MQVLGRDCIIVGSINSPLNAFLTCLCWPPQQTVPYSRLVITYSYSNVVCVHFNSIKNNSVAFLIVDSRLNVICKVTQDTDAAHLCLKFLGVSSCYSRKGPKHYGLEARKCQLDNESSFFHGMVKVRQQLETRVSTDNLLVTLLVWGAKQYHAWAVQRLL